MEVKQGNRLITEDEFVKELIRVCDEVGKQHGLTEDEIAKLTYSSASAIGSMKFKT